MYKYLKYFEHFVGLYQRCDYTLTNMDILVKSGQGSAEIVSQYDRNSKSIWCVSSINVWIPVTIRRQILKSHIFGL